MLGPIFADIAGTELTNEERELLRHTAVGGVVLFERNYQSKSQLQQLCNEIRGLRSPALLITVDHEGGRVQRFRDEFTLLPALESLGDLAQTDLKKAKSEAYHWGQLMASELKTVGVDLSFAPVLDLNKGICAVLRGGRAVAADVATTTTIASAYVDGMHAAGMAAVGKHFPGHGSVSADSHVDLPVDEREYDQIANEDLQVFVNLANELDAIMPAHIIFPKVDKMPASLSRCWLQTILRQQLNYQGLVISDCLSMAGATNVIEDPLERTQAALDAGCDFILMCNNPNALQKIIISMTDNNCQDMTNKIQRLRDRGHTQ